jgi:diguanylate cyclase (GGDEF)-like protein/PAS domain S-box-containing protein
MRKYDYSKLTKIIESVNAIIWEYDILEDNWVYVSPQTKTLLGYEQKEWTNLDFWENNIHEDDRTWAKNYCLKCTKMGEDHTFEYRFNKNNGKYIWIRDEVVVIMENNEPVKLRGFMIDITELKERENKTKYLSFHDELTGLYNRRYFENEMERLEKSRFNPISIIVGDIDKLKNINDTYGHKKGDEYIKRAADAMKEVIRDEDVVARIGGDEFCIILPNMDHKYAIKLARRIKKSFEKLNKKYNLKEQLSISLGYATRDLKESSLEDTFIEADLMMYQNKKHC